MLHTNLDHLESEDALKQALEEHENVMVCCGRMGPMCVPIYNIMDKIKSSYSNVFFADQDFDGPGSSIIRNLPECASFMGLPFTIYFNKGKVVAATTSLQTEPQIVEMLKQNFSL